MVSRVASRPFLRHSFTIMEYAAICGVSDFDIGTRASLRLIGLGVSTRMIDRDATDRGFARADRRAAPVRLLPMPVVVYLVLALCCFTSSG